MNAVHVSARRTDCPGRWFHIALSCCDRGTDPFLNHAGSFEAKIDPMDELAKTYSLDNWESGILSGIHFVLRRMPSREWGVILSKLEGCLGSDDMTALATGASLAVIELHALTSIKVPTADWDFRIETPALNGAPQPLGSNQPV